nr:PREDICTED: uncharacterized protein LOC100879096 [Megachile rotundata]
MNLMLVGFNMTAISLTAIQVKISLRLSLTYVNCNIFELQIIMHFDRPADAMRFVLFLIAQNFHLFVISANGQILTNHAFLLPDKIFSSNWYEIPVKFQKLLYTMIIRCNRPCILSAGGLYDMNIENFGKVCTNYVGNAYTCMLMSNLF